VVQFESLDARKKESSRNPAHFSRVRDLARELLGGARTPSLRLKNGYAQDDADADKN
jgi:hypothetical protein